MNDLPGLLLETFVIAGGFFKTWCSLPIVPLLSAGGISNKAIKSKCYTAVD